MHATPQRLRIEEPAPLPSLRVVPPGPKLSQRMLRLLRLLGISFWRAFVHDAFAIAKASAYSSILTFFPGLVIVGSVLANWRKGAPYLREISYALGSILPAGSNTVLNYLKGAGKHPVGFLLTTSVITLWTASGVMISWMEGFRRCYELPKTWGLVKERLDRLSAGDLRAHADDLRHAAGRRRQQVRNPPSPLHRSRFQPLRSAALGQSCAGSSRP